jgi:hypothetical protein
MQSWHTLCSTQFSKFMFSSPFSRSLFLGGIVSSSMGMFQSNIHAEEQRVIEEQPIDQEPFHIQHVEQIEEVTNLPSEIQTPSNTNNNNNNQIQSETPVFQAEIVPDASKYKKKHRKYGCLRFGSPSEDNIKYREGYVSSYNRRTRTANWVGESLKAESLQSGLADRVNSTFKEVCQRF